MMLPVAFNAKPMDIVGVIVVLVVGLDFGVIANFTGQTNEIAALDKHIRMAARVSFGSLKIL